MKILISIFLATQLPAEAALAGSVIYRSGYSTETVLQGRGKTLNEAARDALCSIPKGWELDPGNSPAFSCTMAQELPSKSLDLDGRCSSAISGNQITFTIPLIPTDLKERETYYVRKPWLKNIAAGKAPKRSDGWDFEKVCGR